MKRLISMLLAITLLLAACGANPPTQETSSIPESGDVPSSQPAQTSSAEPVADKPEATYLKFANTDWGMTVEEVATAMGWSDSDWVKFELPPTDDSKIFNHKKNNMDIEQFSVTADVTFLFEETGLIAINLHCKEEVANSIMEQLGAKYPALEKSSGGADGSIYGCGGTLSEHPKWEQMRAQLEEQGEKTNEPMIGMASSFRADGKQPLVCASYFRSGVADGAPPIHEGLIVLDGSAVAWAKSLE